MISITVQPAWVPSLLCIGPQTTVHRHHTINELAAAGAKPHLAGSD